MVQWSPHHDEHITALLALPLALIQSHIFWLVSVLWTLCTAPLLVEETSDAPTTFSSSYHHHHRRHHHHHRHRHRHTPIASHPSSSPPTPNNSTNVVRRRGSSEPSLSTFDLPSVEMRPRGATISLPPRRPRLFQRPHLDDSVIRPRPSDERIGTTCPPQWWQKTRFYLDARKINTASTSMTTSADRSCVDNDDGTGDRQQSQEPQEPHKNAQEPSKPQQQQDRLHKFWQHHPEMKLSRRATILGPLRIPLHQEELKTCLLDGAANIPRRSKSLFKRKKAV